MDDLIRKQDVFKLLIEEFKDSEDLYLAGKLFANVDMIPTVNAEPVVRCKDCVYYSLGKLICRSRHLNGITPMNGYCHNGKTYEMVVKEIEEKRNKIDEKVKKVQDGKIN